MNFLSSIVSENLINALGWTLIHSLWQGAAVALGFALVMLFMRRFSARTRYYMGVTALLLVLAMSVVTFAGIYRAGMEAPLAAAGVEGSEIALTGVAGIEENITTVMFFKNYFSRHLPLVVTIWMLGMLVLMLRLAGGFIYNQRLKSHQTRPLPGKWDNWMRAFRRKTGIRRTIQLMESALVKIPMTLGHFKPVILFPVGMVTGLPRDQVEALLAHELAHIVRKDYLVNIMQNFVDILFFYHPGVHWISSHTRAERENCCDDIAVSLSGDSINVARALSNIQGHGLSAANPAMAASGSRGLLGRIKRLVRPRTAGSSFAEGAVGAFILVVGLLTLVVSADAATAMNRDIGNDVAVAMDGAQPPQPAQPVQPADEEKDREKELEKKRQEKALKLEAMLKAEKMELKKKKEEMLKLKQKLRTQNRKLTTKEKEKLNMMRKELKLYEKKLQELEILNEKYGADREKVLESLEKEELLKMRKSELAAEKRKLEEKAQKLKQLEKDLLKKNGKLSKDDKKKLDTLKKELQIRMVKLKKSEFLMQEKMEMMRKEEAVMRAEEKKMQKEVEKMRRKEAVMREKMDRIKKILVTELLKDKLIADAADFEFKLNKKEFIINGKTQPEAVLKKYTGLYEKITGNKLGTDKSYSIGYIK
ncbi:MAG: M48 family metalloprotease [bacterium]|nr:M48 family metalloprotease [bacterium]